MKIKFTNYFLTDLLVYLCSSKFTYSTGRKYTHDYSHYIGTILHIFKTGSQWNLYNGELSGSTYYRFFSKMCFFNIFEEAYNYLYQIHAILNKHKLNGDFFIDSTSIKNMFGIDLIGKDKKFNFKCSTKITIIVDKLGIPIDIILSEGNRNDSKIVYSFIKNMNIEKRKKIKNLIGDKGYNSYNLRNNLQKHFDINLIYPNKTNQKKNLIEITEEIKQKLKNRIISENSFCWLKKYKRIVIRQDKFSCIYKSMVYLAYSMIICNKYELDNYNFSDIKFT